MVRLLKEWINPVSRSVENPFVRIKSQSFGPKKDKRLGTSSTKRDWKKPAKKVIKLFYG